MALIYIARQNADGCTQKTQAVLCMPKMKVTTNKGTMSNNPYQGVDEA